MEPILEGTFYTCEGECGRTFHTSPDDAQLTTCPACGGTLATMASKLVVEEFPELAPPPEIAEGFAPGDPNDPANKPAPKKQ